MKAHSIKNPKIIHFIRKEGIIRKERYVCFNSCYPTKKKSTKDWKKVTCKNCLRLMNKAVGK